jgi:hypothetical protein
MPLAHSTHCCDSGKYFKTQKMKEHKKAQKQKNQDFQHNARQLRAVHA